VYRVEHTLLGRAAAVKVLQPELSRNQDMVDRFFNEARATAQLQHPGIVEVFDFGYAEDGAAFIVMELLHGENLTSRIAREGRLPWPTACRFARQIASALAAAHRAQIVHRDLKPDNVFLVIEPDQREERTKVLDFGIAKLADAGASGSVKTRADLIMGTPAYMSPQQCRGAGQVDHRADIYSLGCIVFEMVCGRPPFVGEGFGDLVAAHMVTPPPPPRQLAVDLPGPLERLILRMLAKAEADRPQSMEAVAVELEAIATAYGADVGTTTMPSQPGLSGDMSGSDSGISRMPAVTTLGGSTGERVTTAPPPRRRSPYALVFAGAATIGMAGSLIAILVMGRDAPSGAPAEPPIAAVAAPTPPTPPPAEPPPPSQTERVVRPSRITRRVISQPAGAEVRSQGVLLGTTPLELERPRSGEAEPITLRLAGYVERTIEIVADQDGMTDVVLEPAPPPAPPPVPHRPAPARPADRPVKPASRAPCATRARADAPAGPRVYDPYDPCPER